MHKVLTLHIIHIYRHVLNSQAYSLCLLARPISHKIKCMSVSDININSRIDCLFTLIVLCT